MDVEPKIERKFLGRVEVDSGTLLVGDPCYCLPDAGRGKTGIDYKVVNDAVSTTGTPHGQYLGGEPVILVSGFGGDGTFPVYAEYSDDAEIDRIVIEFVRPDDEDEEPDSIR